MSKIKEQELIIISFGEYSDYFVYGVYKAKKDINLDQLREDYLDKFGNQGMNPYVKFLGWLLEQGYVDEIKSREWHLGGYGEMKFSLGEKGIGKGRVA